MFFPDFNVFYESTDMIDTAKILVFIRGETKPLSVHEDLLGLVSLRGTTRGLDVKEAVLKLLRNRVSDLPLSKLVDLTTDGAPFMIGKKMVLWRSLRSICENQNLSKTFILFIVSPTKRFFVPRP